MKYNRISIIPWIAVILFFILIFNLDIFDDFKGTGTNSYMILFLLGGIFIPLIIVVVVFNYAGKSVKKEKRQCDTWNDLRNLQSVEDELYAWIFGGVISGYFFGIILGIIFTILNFNIT